jgi:hypothetical protein
VRSRLVLLFLLWPLFASAESTRTIDHARILVADLLPNAPKGLSDIDLGPSPAPGGSRVVTKDEIRAHLVEHGVDTDKLMIPERVRVVAASRRIAPAELQALARPSIEKALAAGVTLVALSAGYEVVVAPCAQVGAARIPKLPRQKGTVRTTVTLDMVCGREVVARVPLSVTVELGEAALAIDVTRGARVSLVLTRGVVRITTSGSVLADASVGDTVGATVVATGRVVKVRITSPREAEVVEAL